MQRFDPTSSWSCRQRSAYPAPEDAPSDRGLGCGPSTVNAASSRPGRNRVRIRRIVKWEDPTRRPSCDGTITTRTQPAPAAAGAVVSVIVMESGLRGERRHADAERATGSLRSMGPRVRLDLHGVVTTRSATSLRPDTLKCRRDDSHVRPHAGGSAAGHLSPGVPRKAVVKCRPLSP